MTIDQLREVHKARPFQPFTLHLADGRPIRVPHPEFLAYFSPRARTVSVAISEHAFEIIDLLLVVSIELGNGKPRRRKR